MLLVFLSSITIEVYHYTSHFLEKRYIFYFETFSVDPLETKIINSINLNL